MGENAETGIRGIGYEPWTGCNLLRTVKWQNSMNKDIKIFGYHKSREFLHHVSHYKPFQ
jgi:hypothetical protein